MIEHPLYRDNVAPSEQYTDWVQDAADERYVYFIYAAGQGLIKIGISKSPEARMYALQQTAPVELKLIGVFRTHGRLDENELHKKFERDRLTEEWFKHSTVEWFFLSSALSKYINHLKLGDFIGYFNQRDNEHKKMWRKYSVLKIEQYDNLTLNRARSLLYTLLSFLRTWEAMEEKNNAETLLYDLKSKAAAKHDGGYVYHYNGFMLPAAFHKAFVKIIEKYLHVP